MPEIKSSTIKSCEHNAETGDMTVCFHKGQNYIYKGVDAAMYKDLLGAESPGSFFHRNIRGKFPHSKVEE